MYDNLFSGPRPYNKAVYKALFSDEIIKTGPLTQAIINPSKPLSEQKKNEDPYDHKKPEKLEESK